MPTLQDLRARLPLLEGLDDESAVLAIQQAYYPSVPVEAVAQRLGYTPPKPSDQPLPERSMLAAVNDTVIEAGNAVAGGVGSVANFVAPGNAVSSFIDENIIRPGKENQSDRKKAIDARLAADLAGAEGVGDELAAVGRYAASDPLGVIGQAAGSFVIPGAAVKGAGMLSRAVGLGGRATGAGMAGGAAAGAALSGGDAAGQAYEESLRAGATEDQAQAAARQASMIPAAVGAAGGMFGAERLLAGGRGFAGGAASRAIKSGLSEGAQEAIEEGVTQFEANRAVAPFDGRDPTKGVAAAGMLGALMGGPTGAAVSLMTPEPPKLPRLDKKAPSLAESLTKIAEAPTVDDAIKAIGDALDPAAKPEQAATGGGLDRLRTVLPDEQRREVIGLMATAGNPNAAPHVRRFAENRIDAIIREYTDIPVADVIEEADMLPTGEARELTDAERADFASARRFSDERRIARGIPTGEATEALPVGDATEVEPIPVGDAAEAIPAGEAFETLPVGEATEAIPTGEATELPKRIPTGTATELTPEVIDGDLLTGDQLPYGTRAGALIRARREGLGPENVVEIPGAGYVVRPIIEARPAGTRGTGAADVLPKETPREPVNDMAGTAGEPVAAGAGRAPDAGGSGVAVGRVAADAGGREPDAAGTPVAGGAEAAPAGDGGGADAALSVPAFADYASAQKWVDRKAKEYGTKRAFMASPEYREAYPQIRALYDADKAGGDAKRMQSMTDAGIKVGDTVTTFVRSGYLGGETRTGKIVMRGGTPTVQLDGEMAVERSGRIAYVKSLPWDKRWSKPKESDAKTKKRTEDLGKTIRFGEWRDIGNGYQARSGAADDGTEQTQQIKTPDGNIIVRGIATNGREYMEFESGTNPLARGGMAWVEKAKSDLKALSLPAIGNDSPRIDETVGQGAKVGRMTPDGAALQDDQVKAGLRFVHRRVYDADGGLLNFVVTRVANRVVYYRAEDSGASYKASLGDEFRGVVGRILPPTTSPQGGEGRAAPADVSPASPGRVEAPAADRQNDTAAKLQARQDRKARTERDEPTIELRKRLSVLRSLKECLG